MFFRTPYAAQIALVDDLIVAWVDSIRLDKDICRVIEWHMKLLPFHIMYFNGTIVILSDVIQILRVVL